MKDWRKRLFICLAWSSYWAMSALFCQWFGNVMFPQCKYLCSIMSQVSSQLYLTSFFSFLISCMCVYLHVHGELLFLEISSLKKWHFQEMTSCFQVYTKSRETDLICILEWFHEQWQKSKIFKSKMSKARYNPLVKGGYTGATLVNQSSHSHSLFISWVDLGA